MASGCLILETGEVFKGFLYNEIGKAGEVVFNTSHSGYEEIATDPSYHNQIIVMTNPLQGNYGSSVECWESEQLWIKGFVCLEIQNSSRDKQWLEQLQSHNIPVLSHIDTRQLVLRLRTQGAVWGAIVPQSLDSYKKALELIKKEKNKPKDWTKAVCIKEAKIFKGEKRKGPKLALIDFGFKKNILREMLKRSSEVCIFPSHISFSKIRDYNPDAFVLSNGPGDPKDVLEGTQLVKKLLSWKPLFGICMGHQILAQALGAETYKLKFGHRGSNHPIQDKLLNRIYISAQNHGYAVLESSLPSDVRVSHINLNDKTVSGIFSEKLNCLGVQFHPENCPGPREGNVLFDFFLKNLKTVSSKKNLVKKVISKNSDKKNNNKKLRKK